MTRIIEMKSQQFLVILGSLCIVDIDNGDLELPEELPEFPYESELCEEIKSAILEHGGTEGAEILKEHAKETRLVFGLINQIVSILTWNIFQG